MDRVPSQVQAASPSPVCLRREYGMASKERERDGDNPVVESPSTAAKDVEDTLKRAGEELESLKKTIAALDNFETRWKDLQRQFTEALSISLASAFGGEPPNRLSKEEKEAVFGGKPPTIEDVCQRLKSGGYKSVIVMTGAGISVSAGIPDYRTPGVGLYETLNLKEYGVPSPQALCDIEFFRKNPEPYFKYHKELFYGGKEYQPTPSHYFVRLLADKKILLRYYTQNIDNLESKADIPAELLVQAHGSYQDGTCTNTACKKAFSSSNYKKVKAAILEGKVPRCDACSDGIVKPNIVFYGEDLPLRFKDLLEDDFAKCDLLIVMGTSLKVQPFCSLIHRVRQTTPRVLLNRDRVGSFTLASEGGYRDVALLEDCDEGVAKICQLCGWTKNFDKLIHRKKKTPAAGASASGTRSRNAEPLAFQSSSPARANTHKLTTPKKTTPTRASNHKHAHNPYKK